MLYSLQFIRYTALLSSILSLPGAIVGITIPITIGYFLFFLLTKPAVNALRTPAKPLSRKELSRFRIGIGIGMASSLYTIYFFYMMSGFPYNKGYDKEWWYITPVVMILTCLLLVIDYRLGSRVRTS